MKKIYFVFVPYVAMLALASGIFGAAVTDIKQLRLDPIEGILGLEKKPLATEIPGKPRPEVPPPPSSLVVEPPIHDLEKVNEIYKERTGKECKRTNWFKIFFAYPLFGLVRDVGDLPFSIYDYTLVGFDYLGLTGSEAKVGEGLFDIVWTLLLFPDVLCLGHVDELFFRLGSGEHNMTYLLFYEEKPIGDTRPRHYLRDWGPFPNLRNWKFRSLKKSKLRVFRSELNREIEERNRQSKEALRKRLEEIEQIKAAAQAYDAQLAELNAETIRNNQEIDRTIASINGLIANYNAALNLEPEQALSALEDLSKETAMYGGAWHLNRSINERRQALDAAVVEKKELELACEAGTLESLQQFIERYPLGFYVGKARNKLSELEKAAEDKAFDKAVNEARLTKNPVPLDEFLRRYPNTLNREVIEQIKWELLPKVRITGNAACPDNIPVLKEPKLGAETIETAKKGTLYVLEAELTTDKFFTVILKDGRIGYVHKGLAKEGQD